MRTELWSVWVGGVEVNNYYRTKAEAECLAEQWEADGYDDVRVMRTGKES